MGLSRPYPGTVRPPIRPYHAEVEPKKTIFLLFRVVIPAWNWLIHLSPGLWVQITIAGSKPAARARPLFHSPIRLQPDGKFSPNPNYLFYFFRRGLSIFANLKYMILLYFFVDI